MDDLAIAEAHKKAKAESYWENLTGGVTAAYKYAALDALIREHAPSSVTDLCDIGCGTCEAVLHYQQRFPGSRAVCMDYDANVVARLQARHPQAPVTWLVADAFALEQQDRRFDLLFLLDMVHEIYSFYGRPDRRPDEPIDHELGLAAVTRLLRSVAAAVRPGGLILLTDNVLCEEHGPVRIGLKTRAAACAVRTFFDEYPSRRIPHHDVGTGQVELAARDFCILLTQYNKIRNADWPRWNVEKMEIHQYYSLSEYQEAFHNLGFDLYAVIGTPEATAREWNEDFAVLEGLADLPPKRITLAARKREV